MAIGPFLLSSARKVILGFACKGRKHFMIWTQKSVPGDISPKLCAPNHHHTFVSLSQIEDILQSFPPCMFKCDRGMGHQIVWLTYIAGCHPKRHVEAGGTEDPNAPHTIRQNYI